MIAIIWTFLGRLAHEGAWVEIEAVVRRCSTLKESTLEFFENYRTTVSMMAPEHLPGVCGSAAQSPL
jgi:hypothetical protein